MIQLIKASQLSQTQFEEAKALNEMAQNYDGYNTYFYWNSIAKRTGNDLTDFLFYIDNQLVGYLATFEFDNHSAEVCAVVHPKFRHKHIFTRLFEEAQIEMKAAGLFFCDVICHPFSMFGKQALKKVGAIYRTTEFEMVATSKLTPIEKRADIKIRRADKEDYKLLAMMGSECFESTIDEEVERLQSMTGNKERSIYIAYLNDLPVGKVHCIKRDEVYLHDFCVLPAFQGQGITRVFLQKVANRFFQYGANAVTLNITADNPKALALYRNCGFHERDSQEYWRYVLVPMPTVNEVIH